jgi:hypothetical protein
MFKAPQKQTAQTLGTLAVMCIDRQCKHQTDGKKQVKKIKL